jgi:hypothetical protein
VLCPAHSQARRGAGFLEGKLAEVANNDVGAVGLEVHAVAPLADPHHQAEPTRAVRFDADQSSFEDSSTSRRGAKSPGRFEIHIQCWRTSAGVPDKPSDRRSTPSTRTSNSRARPAASGTAAHMRRWWFARRGGRFTDKTHCTTSTPSRTSVRMKYWSFRLPNPWSVSRSAPSSRPPVGNERPRAARKLRTPASRGRPSTYSW